MIKTLFKFFGNPYSFLGTSQGEKVRERLDFVKKAILFSIGSSLAILMMIAFTIEMPLRNFLNISLFEARTHNMQTFRESLGPTREVLNTCLAAPFFEEGVFRFILIAKSRCLQIISVLLILDAITSFHSFFISHFQYDVIVLPVLFMLFCYNIFLTRSDEMVLQKEYYNYACWFSIIIFGLVHIGNFTPIDFSVLFLYPFYVLPQMVYGVVLSYAAVKYKSIILPFLIHAGINSSTEVLSFLTSK